MTIVGAGNMGRGIGMRVVAGGSDDELVDQEKIGTGFASDFKFLPDATSR